ncbi:N-acetylglucosaminyl-phosphatidylinositol biosynthetic protein gpi1 [Hypsizygus marmoreus]|uniref:N-acetylglucosaminyl-phosphatidylinositol biosynthetic protein gpi1 n=1 Tax=Hypsizygus marmoreus TaxID=39966 RepID=A0A369JMD6_HYPMA|nr:N-acetylglucosaminyl-phosphatidylinositol biosynthetic protein gpi1 [Hypsizygus marmoreus]
MPTTIFWPSDVKHSGFCYGWTTPAICVAGVLQAESEQDAEQTLKTFCDSLQWRLLATSCGSEPIILGTCRFNQKNGGHSPTVPKLKLLDLVDYILIYYTRHHSNTLRFYSLDVLRLDATNRPDVAHGSAYLPSAQHDFTAPMAMHFHSGINHTAINQFNSAKTLEQAIQVYHQTSTIEAPFTARLISHGASILRPLTSISDILTSICNVPILFSFSSPVLKDVSATVQQIDVRAEQIEFFATEVGSLRRRSSTPVELYSARYTNFFNAVWLILNDITIGVALGSFICENHVVLSRMLIQIVEGSLINWVQWALRWLDSWPAGLKLNTELSRFYSHSFIGLVTLWGAVLMRGAPYLPMVLYTIGSVSCGGVTLTISLFLDMLALLTAHIYVCYVISASVYQRMLKTAGSLWNLFRGKRYNVLRNRTDSWEYDIDQLLFGTILFTLLAFLFPTVLAYYSLFALMRLCVLIVQASLETLLALMNHFPLFALMFRVKDPWRLPGGIFFLRQNLRGSTDPVLVIKNQPVPLSSIFFQYIQLLSQLAKHYNPLRLLRCLFSGQYLAAIPRYSIRYNKIPSHIED